MKISSRGLELIKKYEGCRLTAYLCPAGVWTIGYGHTEGVQRGDRITKTQAEAMLLEDMKHYELAVNVEDLALDQHQFDALVSFCYNVGAGNMRGSTLMKKVRVNADDRTIANEFAKWVYAGGVQLEGLVKRREDEANMYFS